jgi:nucleotide-binding universal stress UspA family protein
MSGYDRINRPMLELFDRLRGRDRARDPKLAIKRILVALDASTYSLAALEAAAVVAAGQRAELVGLFVEDENLLHLAGLPFAHQVRAPSARRESIDSDEMEQNLRLQASQARRALEAAAGRFGLRWSFHAVRGQVTARLLEAALEADMLAMGRVSRPFSSRGQVGSTARAAMAKTKHSLLLMPQGSNLSYPVLVTYDGSPAGKQALLAATRMTWAGGNHLTVLLLSDSLEEVESLREEVNERLEERGLVAQFNWMPQATVDKLVELTRTFQNCVVILGGDNPLVRADAIQELLDATDCPVMLIR